MLKKYLNKINWIRFIAVSVLLSLLFICKGVGINTMLHGGMSHKMMPCCDKTANTMFGDPMDKFVATIPAAITFFATLFVIFTLFGKSISIEEYKIKAYWYDFWLRRRIGSTHMYNFFNRLLSLGILQPKLF